MPLLELQLVLDLSEHFIHSIAVKMTYTLYPLMPELVPVHGDVDGTTTNGLDSTEMVQKLPEVQDDTDPQL